MNAYKITLEANFSLNDKALKKWLKKTKAYFNSENIEDLDFFFLYNEDFIKFIKDSSMFTINGTKIENKGKLVPFGSSYIGEKQLEEIKQKEQV